MQMKKILLIGLLLSSILPVKSNAQVGSGIGGGIVITASPYISPSGVTVGVIKCGVTGTAAAPCYSFLGATNYGIYLDSGAFTTIAAAGNTSAGFSASSLIFPSTNLLTWTNSTIAAGPDIVFRHSAAKTLTLDTDGAGGALTLVDVKGPLAVSGVIKASDGTFALPSYTFSSNTDLGFYRKGAAAIGISSSGALVGEVGLSGGANGYYQILANNPALYFNTFGSIRSSTDGVLQLVNNAATGFTRLILGTNDATANGSSFLLNSGGLEAKTGDATAFIPFKASTLTATGLATIGSLNVSSDQFHVTTAGLVSIYKNVATAGWGVPSIVAAGRVTAQTSANASVTTYTVGAADGSFDVDGSVLVTASTTHSFSINVAYTDEGNTARTVPMLVVAPGSVSAFLIANAQGAVPWTANTMHIRCKAATTITVTTSGTFTSVTYNAEGSIRQIS